MPDPIAGVHLRRTDENVAEIDALATLVGGRAGLGAVLDDLDRRGRRGWAPGLKSRRAFTWDRADRRTTQWWPQGISTSADASDTELVHGRRLVVTTWYAKDLGDGNHGSRLSFVDLATRRYRHVLLVVPRIVDGDVRVEPLEIHAGGLAWHGPWLHVAATAAGLFVFHVDDIVRVPEQAPESVRVEPLESHAGGLAWHGPWLHVAATATGLFVFHVDDIVRVPEQAPESVRVAGEEYRYLLPVRFAYEARTDDGHERLRYSFVSLDRASSPPQLLAGEYGRGRQTRRLAHFALDPDSRFVAPGGDGACRPQQLHDEGIGQAQGVVQVDGRYYVTTSHGPWKPGSVHVGVPGAWRSHRWAVPMGPEDLAYWPSRDELWSLSEHPRRRWVFSVRRSRLTP